MKKLSSVVILGVVSCFSANYLSAKTFFHEHESKESLEYGVVLMGYYSGNYFEGLVEQAYVEENKNLKSLSPKGQALKGGMMTSYGLGIDAHKLFMAILSESQSVPARNRAWYYLAELHYAKSDMDKAETALQSVNGEIDDDIRVEFHYLKTLIEKDENSLLRVQRETDGLPRKFPIYSYLLFNLAIEDLDAGATREAIARLEKVANYKGGHLELRSLADRARHGLALIALTDKDYETAWKHLSRIQTSGLYSNRALLAYAWSAIRLQKPLTAIPALKLLEERSIAIPEVQEGKVLLAHLYEQESDPKKALKTNLLAIQSFQEGIVGVAQAREIIARQDVPREYIENMDAISDQSDWYGIQPTLDYKKLTPFLIDLTSSHSFREILKELRDLYAVEENLKSWLRKEEGLYMTFETNQSIATPEKFNLIVSEARQLNSRLKSEVEDFRLGALAFEDFDQQRLNTLLEATDSEMVFLDSRIESLRRYREPFIHNKSLKDDMDENYRKVRKSLVDIHQLIDSLEPVMRTLVNVELDRHEERMRYYWAQSRLAKARLYDTVFTKADSFEFDSEVLKKDKGVNND